MKKTVLLTGPTGAMGKKVLEYLYKNIDEKTSIRLFVHNTPKDLKQIQKYKNLSNIEIIIGDLTNYLDAYKAVKNVSMVLHVAALVSPLADYNPSLAMEINYGGTKNLIDAIINQGQIAKTKFVFIGTIAQTGDRLPPIHWGRVGDPIKPSIFDYYAVSKVKAERYLIESDLKYWVSLRQTGIIGKEMYKKSDDAIMFHNGLNNVLEYISDNDSGKLLSNLWYKDLNNTLNPEFWNHIYNVGGGKSTRVDTITLFENVYKILGIKDLKYVIDPKLFASCNFHGTYYLDSDKLNDYLDFRSDSIEYFYSIVKKQLGFAGLVCRVISKFLGGHKIIGYFIKRRFNKIAKKQFGTLNFLENNLNPQINAYFESKEQWQAIPNEFSKFQRATNLDEIVQIDHGYDEGKSKDELSLEDLNKAVSFRGGTILSKNMIVGDWKTKLSFKCAFNHIFKASPKLILEGGHWCDVCEDSSWNYDERAKRDKFFAQVWNPIRKSLNGIRIYQKKY